MEALPYGNQVYHMAKGYTTDVNCLVLGYPVENGILTGKLWRKTSPYVTGRLVFQKHIIASLEAPPYYRIALGRQKLLITRPLVV